MVRVLGCLAVAMLTACGAGGGDGPTPSRAQQAANLAQTLEATNVSDPAALPTTGASVYHGFMTAGLPTGAGGARTEYLGDLRMQVDFAAPRDQVSGRARNFTSGAQVLTGALRLQGGDLFRNTVVDENYTFTGDVNGALGKGPDTYVIDAEIAGEFRGRDQEGVSGLLFGDVQGPLGQDIFDGTFYAAVP